MNAPLDIKMDKATFLRWAEGREGRWELIRGRPIMQDTGTRRHSDIGQNIEQALRSRLGKAVWRFRRGDLSVEIGEETRVPDVMVEPRGLPSRALASADAVLLCEVLSPSSSVTDLNAKRRLYSELATLRAYIVLSQDQPTAWVWQRADTAPHAFPDAPTTIAGLDGVVTLDHLGVSIPMSEIYDDVAWD